MNQDILITKSPYGDMPISEIIKLDNFMEHVAKARLTVKHDGEYMLLDYSQTDSPRKHWLADQCRGLIIHKPSNTIARRMFNRFYNLGEYPELEAIFEEDDMIAQSKEDGSVIGLWYHHEKGWCTGTRGSMYGLDNLASYNYHNILDGVHKSDINFNSLVHSLINIHDMYLQNVLNPQYTYIFELCSPFNKVVTPYNKPELYLLAIIDNTTGKEAPSWVLDNIAAHPFNCLRPKVYPVESFNDAKHWASQLTGMKEGFVLVDKNGHRLKLKTEKYVLSAHINGHRMPDLVDLVGLVIKKEHYEFISYHKEYTKPVFDICNGLEKLEAFCLSNYDNVKNIKCQKEFAKTANKTLFPQVLFRLRKGEHIDNILYSKPSFTANLLTKMDKELK